MDRSHHTKPVDSDEHRIRTGRRKAVDIDAPRDKTVCFMTSEAEKAQIDLIGVGIQRTRSALLTRIVNTFVDGVMAKDDWQLHADELTKFMSECRDAMSESNHPLLIRK